MADSPTSPIAASPVAALLAWLGHRIDASASGWLEEGGTSRAAGETDIEGITSFSISPLRFWTYLGVTVAVASFIYGGFIVGRTLIHGVDVPGYASLLTAILFLGGLQLIGLGVLGEYLARVYIESKRRPPYIIREVIEGDQGEA